jgi:hypothetical protein
MKRLTLMGGGILAALAMAATLTAATASATELCSTATTPCSGTKYGSGTTLHAEHTTTAVFVSQITTVTCTSSTLHIETNSSGGATVTAVTSHFIGFIFEGCTRTGGEKCTATTTNLGNATITGGSASTTGTFNFNITSKTGVNLTCGFFINCTFSTSSATLAGRNQTTGKPTVKAELVAMAREGGLCPESSIWTGSYEIDKPTPLFIV